MAREAIERLVDYDDWFVREVEKGLAQIESGQTLSHEQVGARLETPEREATPLLMQLRWTLEAAKDLERIADDLVVHAPSRATELVRTIYAAPDRPVDISKPRRREEGGGAEHR